ncbi:MAG: hypothetical protein ACREXT_02635 [Gammaproteobacteria bacterium]
MVSMRCCCLVFTTVFVVSALAASETNPDGELAATVEVARSYTEAQRKALILKNVDFGKDEAAAFWPVYRDYRTAMAKIQDKRVRIIADYAENYRSMTGDKAKSLLEGYLRTDEDVLKLKRQYLSKFRKGLPETKVARYYQIENKMDALIAAELAVRIPLIAPPQE